MYFKILIKNDLYVEAESEEEALEKAYAHFAGNKVELFAAQQLSDVQIIPSPSK